MIRVIRTQRVFPLGSTKTNIKIKSNQCTPKASIDVSEERSKCTDHTARTNKLTDAFLSPNRQKCLRTRFSSLDYSNLFNHAHDQGKYFLSLSPLFSLYHHLYISHPLSLSLSLFLSLSFWIIGRVKDESPRDADSYSDDRVFRKILQRSIVRVYGVVCLDGRGGMGGGRFVINSRSDGAERNGSGGPSARGLLGNETSKRKGNGYESKPITHAHTHTHTHSHTLVCVHAYLTHYGNDGVQRVSGGGGWRTHNIDRVRKNEWV